MVTGDRTLSVRFDGWRQAVSWGSNVAVLSGALAAGADLTAPAVWLRLAAAYFCAVPLVAGLCAAIAERRRVVSPQPLPPRPARAMSGARPALRLASRARLRDTVTGSLRRGQLYPKPDVQLQEVLVLSGLGTATALLLDPDLGLYMAVIVLSLLVARWDVGSPGGAPWSQTIYGAWVPASFVWLALGGDHSIPAPQAVQVGPIGALAVWLLVNRLPLLLILALTLTHHAASLLASRGSFVPQWPLIVGYLMAIGLLVSSERSLAAGALSMLLLLQLPWLAEPSSALSSEWPIIARRAWCVAALVVSATAGLG